MSKSRRRTLSHLEVENFLNEISNKKTTESDNDNILKPTNLKNISDIIKQESLETLKPIAPPDDAQLIREYCKIKCRGKVHDIFQWEAMRSLSRSIHDKTTYKLMSERLMLPDRFYHPLGSVENRREILLGLSPMLTDADTQRKLEVEACEVYTKCKSSKVRTRNTYEYIDVQTSKVVDFPEYERRYLKYITEAKYNRQQNYNLQLQPALATFGFVKQQPVEDKENIPLQSSSTDSAAKPIRKRKLGGTVLGSQEEADANSQSNRKTSVNRRETLSPGTVRKLLIEKVETAMSPLIEMCKANDSTNVAAFPQLQTLAPSPADSSATASFAVPADGSLSPINDIDYVPFDEDLSMDSSSFGDDQSHQKHGGARRSTLSPSAARLIAMEIMTEQEEEVSAETSPVDKVPTIPEEGISSENLDDILCSPSESNTDVEDEEGETESCEDQENVQPMSDTEEKDAHIELNTDPSEILENQELEYFSITVTTSAETQQDMDVVVGEAFESKEPESIVNKDEIMTKEHSEIRVSSISQVLFPIEIPANHDAAVISFASEVSDMIAASPTRRFFGRKSEGNIVNRGLQILDGSESELEAFEMLESFVSGVILAKSMEADSPHFISPERNTRKLNLSATKAEQPSSSAKKRQCDVLISPGSSRDSSSNKREDVEATSCAINSSNILDFLSDEIDETEWEKRASQRMRDRFAAARWQYLWEIVSAQAANKAIHETRKKQKLNA